MHCDKKMRTVGQFYCNALWQKDDKYGNSSTIMRCGRKMRTVGQFYSNALWQKDEGCGTVLR